MHVLDVRVVKRMGQTKVGRAEVIAAGHNVNVQIGQWVFVLPRIAVAQDFPFKCVGGHLGGANASEQMSPFCAERCPKGYRCSVASITL